MALLLPLLSFAQGPPNCNSFEWVNPLPTANNYYDADFLGADTIYVGGDRETLLRSTDGGSSWEKLDLDLDLFAVRAVEFLDADTAIIAASNSNLGRIYRTTDGGANWNQPFPTFSGSNSTDIQFLNHDTGFVATGVGIFRTEDAGVNWTQFPSGSGVKVHFVNSDTGMVINGVNQVKRTTNGGTNWATTTLPNSVLQDFAFVDGLTGYVFTSSGDFFKTTDAGASWNVHPNPGFFGNPHTMVFVDGVGYATSVAGPNTYLYQSSDSGNTFTPVQIYPWFHRMNDLHFRTASQGLAIGLYGGMAITQDSANSIATWPQGGVDSEYLSDLAFPSQDTGYICGIRNFYRSTDHGQTWAKQAQFSSLAFYTMAFHNNQYGVAFGLQGAAARTSNAGQSWTTFNLSGTHQECQFVNDTLVYVVGIYDGLRISANAGQAWTAKSFGTSGIQYNGLSFRDPQHGLVSGSDGTLLQTSDGGDTWTQHPTGTTKYLLDVHLQDSLRGHAGGEDGTYLRTTDGGTTWTLSTFGNGTDIKRFYFVDSLVGYALLGSNTQDFIYRTTNGGQSWYRAYYDNSSAALRTFHFFNRTEGLSVGHQGTVLRYELGQVNPVAMDQVLCEADSVVLSATGGYNIVWYSDSSFSNPIQNGPTYQTPLISQTDTFYFAEINPTVLNCGNELVPVVVSVVDPPLLGALPLDSTCTPDSLDLTAAVVDSNATAGTYSFWLDSAATLPASNPVVSSGLYYVQKTTADGCSDLQEVEALFFQSPRLFIETPDTVCAPNTVDLTVWVTDSAGTTGSLIWYEDAALSQVLANPSAVDTTGWYYLVKTTPEGCSDLDSVLVVVETCLGRTPSLEANWQLWPNPSRGSIHLESPEIPLQACQWQLFGANGQVLDEGTLVPGTRQWHLELAGLPRGHYWLLVHAGDGWRRLPVVIQ